MNRPQPMLQSLAQGADEGEASPMMAQYLRIKREHPGYLLFFRMGDFYELFFEDAAIAAAALDIALTKRGSHRGADVPMCGVPAHAAESYLERLIRKGHKVAVCDQREDPKEAKKRGGKALMKREVVRLVTPGTLTEDALLEPRRANYLCAMARAGEECALAWADISSGELVAAPVKESDLAAELSRLAPGEILVAETLLSVKTFAAALAPFAARLTSLPAQKFDSAAGERALKRVFDVASLDGFGAFGRAELAAFCGLVDYIDLTQKGRLPALRPPRREIAAAHMTMDAATRRNLELFEAQDGGRDATLFAVVDRTLTAAGARLLAARLAAPLTDPNAVALRLDAVDFFLRDFEARARLRESLKSLPDMARALARLSLSRGGPRDLGALRAALSAAGGIAGELRADKSAGEAHAALLTLTKSLSELEAFAARLRRTLAQELPLLARDGGFVASGALPALDEARALRDETRKVIAQLEARYRRETGVASLKIRHNNVLGYYLEATQATARKFTEPPLSSLFIHRQTMGGAMRFTTSELASLASRIAGAADTALSLELAEFDALAAETAKCAPALQQAAAALAVLDVSAALAELADARSYVRPVIKDEPVFKIIGGRHAVVEALLDEAQAGFVPNDCDLGDGERGRLWLVTGPNMAGKSTFLRQNALIAILAQAGSFVPAKSAELGIVDRLFSRVGAADDLAHGRSTFMVEMVEAAAILNQAGPRALVILDELGRGTATFDGLSIAWAALEHLHDANKCRALFATHYHELTALSERLRSLHCVTMRVKEYQGGIVFLHEVAQGAADRSYGIQVAKLAGLPRTVIERAREVLAALEKGGAVRRVARIVDDLPLFAAAAPAYKQENEIEAALRELNPDALSPKEALELLYRLKALLGS